VSIQATVYFNIEDKKGKGTQKVINKRRIKVLLAKPGLDGHDRGAKVLTMGLRDEGMEVIYTGLRQTPEMIAQATLEEQPDVVALSCLSGAHQSLFPRVVDELQKRGMSDVLVIGGGNIPKEDIPFLLEKGISAVFGPGTSIKEVAQYIRDRIEKSRDISQN
jgi:methylmalonyl-CoA mutase C-terminal domain/subunit